MVAAVENFAIQKSKLRTEPADMPIGVIIVGLLLCECNFTNSIILGDTEVFDRCGQTRWSENVCRWYTLAFGLSQMHIEGPYRPGSSFPKFPQGVLCSPKLDKLLYLGPYDTPKGDVGLERCRV